MEPQTTQDPKSWFPSILLTRLDKGILSPGIDVVVRQLADKRERLKLCYIVGGCDLVTPPSPSKIKNLLQNQIFEEPLESLGNCIEKPSCPLETLNPKTLKPYTLKALKVLRETPRELGPGRTSQLRRKGPRPRGAEGTEGRRGTARRGATQCIDHRSNKNAGNELCPTLQHLT